MKKQFQKRFIAAAGFTLIELLLVIAILGILATAVLIAINPTKRLNQANDSKVKSDISQISQALQAYYTTNAYYPAALTDLKTSGDLTVVPAPPSTSYSAYALVGTPAGCTTAGPAHCVNVALSGTLLAPQTAGDIWCFKSATGVIGEAATCTAP